MPARRHFTHPETTGVKASPVADWQQLPQCWWQQVLKQQFERLPSSLSPVVATVSERISERAAPLVDELLADPRRTLFSVMSIPEKLPDMLALAGVAPFDPLHRVAEHYSWQAKELLQLVNAPRFQELTGWHHVYLHNLTELREAMPDQELAVHLLGYILALNGRRELRHGPMILRQIWYGALEQAQLAWHWAPYFELSAASAATLMLSKALAPMAILQVWEQQTELLREENLYRSRETSQRVLYDALSQFVAQPGILNERLLPDYQNRLLPSLLAPLGRFGRIVNERLAEAHCSLPIRQLSPLSRLIRQVSVFHAWLKLNEISAIDEAATIEAFASVALNAADIERLIALMRPRKLPSSRQNGDDTMHK